MTVEYRASVQVEVPCSSETIDKNVIWRGEKNDKQFCIMILLLK